ncbi:MAG: cyclic nucleotide-binding domain-containing protein [Ignavibacteria bacterium]|jgi:CRP-like cAMP-binding protein|nr:cyclic nucleotide-binding domain-containing protein [Ignavibacteria bacterium]MCU7501475.1 cyclic nucleotide-binding domain-containing protein [Ignavibacteria bacterium]MCU7516009.1 cyclic nucleotide-binding domain-containing protein [Ignavibacteria bacterium]
MPENKLNRQSSFFSNLFKTPAEKNEILELLKSTPPFRSFTAKDVDLLMPIMHNRIYAANEYIFFQDDPGTAFYFIQEGEVSLEMSFKEEKKLQLGHYKKGDFFGELAMLENERRFASAIAVKDSKLIVIFKPDLDEYIDKYPKKGVKVLRGISQIFAHRFRQLNRDYISFFLEK